MTDARDNYPPGVTDADIDALCEESDDERRERERREYIEESVAEAKRKGEW